MNEILKLFILYIKNNINIQKLKLFQFVKSHKYARDEVKSFPHAFLRS